MRIADKMAYNQVNNNVTKNRTDMAELQSQAATQKRVNKPSDDPLAAARVLNSRSDEKSNTQFIRNINNAKSFLEMSDQSLGEVSDLLVRAKELALSQANDPSGNAETRRISASEVSQMLSQAIQVGNRKLGERYIFGGLATLTPPFDNLGTYNGDDGSLKIQTNKDTYIAMNLPGSQVFLGQGTEANGVIKTQALTPTTVEELNLFKEEQEADRLQKEQDAPSEIQLRGPASLKGSRVEAEAKGTNVFAALRSLEISLSTNDKEGIQESLDLIDSATSQIVLARSQVGARVMSINGTLEALQKTVIDNKITASQLEDADVVGLMSEMTKADATLKATLATSGKLIQPSLLDFLR